MASKFGLAGGIPERRVRPIWDAVDSRQFKSALKLSVALLAKYPNSPYALALKALILERMGKPDEALAVCINAKELLYSSNVVQIDDLTLSTLQIVFQRLDRLDLATSCYEHACGKYPNNLEIMMGLFNCYVREYSYVKQQQTAIKMYKIVGEERFLMWAVCSIQLQVICSSGGEKLLALAEALLRKHISSHNLHEPEALVIYISILEQQGKYGDALEVLSGDLGSLIGMEVDKFRMQGRLLALSCDYSAAAEVFQKVLQLCPDDWEAFLHYLRCLLEDNVYWSKVSTTDQFLPSNAAGFQTSKSIHLTEEVFDSRISSALSFVQKLQMEVLSDHVRGPYLANIEIERQCRLNGKTDDGKLVELLLNYFRRFSHLSCFTSDVEMFLPVLNHSEKVELLDTFVKLSESTSMPPVKKLGQTITIFKIQELFGGRFSIPLGELEAIAVNMVEVYCKNLVLSRNLDPQENMHGEELLSMASNVLVQLYWRTSYFGYLLEAIMVLEFGLIIRRYIWQYRIHLLHLYSYMGALPLAHEWYGTLEVKNILLESVSHHILPQMLRSPLWTETADFLREYRRFMDDYLREAADLTYLAYRHRNYSKVIEFVKFKERLQHSHRYLMSSLDESVLQLKQKSDSLEDVEDVLEHFNCGTQLLELSSEDKLKFLTFNEDFQARPWWSPMPDINYLLEPFEGPPVEFRMSSFKDQDLEKEHVRKVVKQKSVLPRLVYLSIKIASTCLKENVQPNGSVSDTDSTSELKFLLEGYARNSGLSFDDAIGVIVEISNGNKSFKDCGSDVAYWVSFAVFVNAWNLRSRHLALSDGDGYNSWHIVNNLFEKYIAEHLISAGPILTSPGSNLPVLVQLITESVSWHVLVIQSYITSLLPPGRKKKKGSVVDQLNSPELQAIRDSIHCSNNVIRLVQNWLTNQIKRPEDECVDVLLSHLHTKEGEEGPGRVLQILERTASASSQEFGLRISGALQSWSSANVARKIASAQSKVLSVFHQICDSKLRLLELLKQSI